MRQQIERSMILYRMTLWLFAACFALLLPFSFKSLETFASSDADIPVTSIYHFYGNYMVLLKKGDSLQDFLNENPDYAMVLAYTSSGSSPVVMSVDFDTTSLDIGLNCISGRVIPDDDHSISEELSSVSLAVWVYDPQNPQILPIEDYSEDALPKPLQQVYTTENTKEQIHTDLIMQNGSLLRCILKGELEDSYILDLPISWDLSGINMQKPGVYEAVGTLPEGLLLPESLAPVSCSVVVQEPGSFLLSPLTRYHSLPAFLWQAAVTPTAEKLTLWYSTGDGNWLADTEEDYFTYLLPGLLALFPKPFLSGTSYYLQVEYENRFSNIMKVQFTDSDLICNDIGGDRDGVDRLPQEVPEPSPDEPADEGTTDEGTPDEGTTGDGTTSEDSDREETTGENTDNEEITGEDAVKEETFDEDTIKEETIFEDTGREEMTGENTGNEEITSENTGNEEITGEDAVKEETFDEDTIKEETIDEDTGREEMTGEDTFKEELTNEEVIDVEVTDIEIADMDSNIGTTEVPESDASSTEPDSITEQTETTPAPENASSPLWLMLPAGSATLLGATLFLYVRRKQLW